MEVMRLAYFPTGERVPPLLHTRGGRLIAGLPRARFGDGFSGLKPRTGGA